MKALNGVPNPLNPKPKNQARYKKINPQKFLADAKTQWPRVPETSLAACNTEETEEIRALEEQIAAGEFAALTDIILHCNNRFQFAKTYKTLWADLRTTLSDPGSPSVPEHKKQAIKAIFDRSIRYKLGQMALWFEFEFADTSDRRQVSAGKFSNAIDIYAGKEGVKAAGCAGAVLLLFASSISLITSLALLC